MDVNTSPNYLLTIKGNLIHSYIVVGELNLFRYHIIEHFLPYFQKTKLLRIKIFYIVGFKLL